MEHTKTLGTEKLLSLYRRYLLIAQMSEKYSDDKQVLRAMGKVAKKEYKGLKGTIYPLDIKDLNTVMLAISQLKDLIASLIKASEVENFQVAATGLRNYIEDLGKTVEELEKICEEASSPIDKLNSAVGQAKEMIGKGKELLEKGVEGIKKTVTDLRSK